MRPGEFGQHARGQCCDPRTLERKPQAVVRDNRPRIRNECIEGCRGQVAQAGEAGEVDTQHRCGEKPSESATVIRGVEGGDDRPAFRRPGAPAQSVHVDHPTASERARGRDVAQDEAVPGEGADLAVERDDRLGGCTGLDRSTPGEQQPSGHRFRAEMEMHRGTVAQGTAFVGQHAHGDVEAGRRPVQVRRQDPRATAHVVGRQAGTGQVQRAALSGACGLGHRVVDAHAANPHLACAR